MVIANLMTCGGFGGFMGCSFAWLGIAILVFVGLIARKQSEDGILADFPINLVGCYVVGGLAYILVVTLTGAAQWALLAGLAGEALGGFGVGYFTGAREGE